MRTEIFNKVKGMNIENAKKVLVENGYCEYFMRVVNCDNCINLKVRDNANTFTTLTDFGNGIEKKHTYKI